MIIEISIHSINYLLKEINISSRLLMNSEAYLLRIIKTLLKVSYVLDVLDVE